MIVPMDIPDPDQASEIARSYLKQVSSTKDGIQKPNVQAWLEVERRLKLSEPDSKTQTSSTRSGPRIQAVSTPRKQSIWKRPISELWR